MTSQSLKKLQTILWSMLPKTEGRPDAAYASRFFRDASLAGIAIITLAAGASADEKTWQSSVTRESSPRQNSTATKERAVRQTSATQFSEWPVAASSARETGTVANPQPARPLTPPEIAARAKQQIAGEPDRQYSRVENSEAGYASRMDYVLSGGVVSNSAESVGDWWKERSGQMMNRDQARPAASGQPRLKRIASATERFADRITLPDEPQPEVDFYESRPISVAHNGVRQTSAVDEPVGDVSAEPISRLKTDIRSIKPTLGYALRNIERDQLPEDFDSRMDNGTYEPRQASPVVYQWAPTNLYHYPLYFEDPSLERYGHTYHPLVQPFASSGRFAVQLVGLPYQMALHPMNSKDYALGYYRPGECAPKKHYQIPFNEEATLVEVATIVGLFLIIP